MMLLWLKFILTCLLLVYNVHSYQILGLFPMASISHHILTTKLIEGLAEAGHEVTMVSPYAAKNVPKHWKYRDIVLDGVDEKFQDYLKTMNLYEMDKANPIAIMRQMSNIMSEIVNNTITHPKMIELTNSNEQFDALIIEVFHLDALKAYASIFNCHQILLSSAGPSSWVNPTVGNPQPVSYVPHMFSGDFSKNLSFWNRSKNLVFYLLDYLMITFFSNSLQDDFVKQICSDGPSVSELRTNASLVLLNSHTSIYPALPLVPNMVEIGGYFIDPPKPLPKDLQNFMDNAKDGVIYFSMGSNLKSKDLPEPTKNGILKVFGKLKQRVIWKFEEDLPNKPANVLIKKWCPQADILAHPKMKLFITHGGLLSTTETIYHGVPILAIPVFGDQPTNAARAEADGYGLKFHYLDFTIEKFESYLIELLNNPKYSQAVKERSKIYHDRPMKPREAAVYWVEYIIRHNGAPHLRVAGRNLVWYKYFMVDVFAALLVVFGSLVYVVKLIVKKFCCRSMKSDRKQKVL
ncbi:UDP-glycosyltransferase UGT5-like isoform X1 [Anthonomus grandis grandis]|uniref:UDP-glycosyltransferase UGT5-like isoform X1 n=1 Tax=Anthonomus grandis grandis TaxID=2921223 RepID=UPI0021653C42|nr:UDP-glycosyltransferase UGT5-like isoform X1 [Anthonomus grandis grandis]